MSVIGTITVHKCDGCEAIAVVHTEEDIASFESNWYAGLMVDFCPDCRHLSRNRTAILENAAHEQHVRDFVPLPATAAATATEVKHA